MNRIISLFLFIFIASCLNGQYNSPIRNKVTLGKQTTADGLVWRGRLADTANLLTNKLDTSVYIVLDTGTRAMWYYRASTTPKWTKLVDSLNNLQGQLSLTTKVTGVLPVANGGTNNTSYISGAIPYSNGTMLTSDTSKLFFDNTNAQLGLNTTNFNDPIVGSSKFKIVDGTMDFSFRDHNNGQGWFAVRSRTNNISGFTGHTNSSSNAFVMGSISNHGLGLRTSNTDRLFISNTGAVTIYNLAGSGSRMVEADLNGVLSAPVSSITTKENVQTLDYGLKEILQIKPVSFDYIDKNKWGEDRKIGFIVEDMFPIIPEVTGIMNDGDLYLDMVKLIPILTKAIQEQQTLIKALEQRILILENK